MGNYNFRKDLAQEQENMPQLIEELKRCFSFIKEAKRYDGPLSDGDLVITFNAGLGNFERLAEVKEDFGAHSGNIAIETFGRGKPTGISVTKSDLWISKAYRGNRQEFLLIPIEILHKACAGKRTIPMGDKGSGTEGYLLRIDILKKIDGVTCRII